MAVEIVTVGIACADVMTRPVDGLPAKGKLNLVPHLELHMGGLAAVTAAVFSRLGGNAAFIGAVGRDGFGEYVLGSLRASGVNTDHVRFAEGADTSATVVLIDSEGERTFLHQVGANAALSEADIDFDFVKQAKVLHWGGPSVTPGLDGAPMGRVFERARALGVRTSMDTCFDGNGTWLPLIEPALRHLDVVMSSYEEACHYTGQTDPEAIAAFYRSFGVSTVLVKMGAEGLFLSDVTGSWRISAHRVPVVDTTGAGDAACGGFLYGYVRGWEPLRCAQLANAVGALTVQRIGGGEAVSSLEQALACMEAH